MSLILVDTSIWIQLFNHKKKDFNHEHLFRFAVCPPIIQEVLQGFKKPEAHQQAKDGMLALPCFSNPLSLDTYLHASDLFRHGRKKWITIRSSTDCLIAAIAIENHVPILHLDRDYKQIAKFSRLEEMSSID